MNERELLKKAEAGDTEAMLMLTRMYMDKMRDNMDIDLYEDILFWTEKAAKLGNKEAQMDLSAIFSIKNSPYYDFEKAIYWLKNLAENNSPYAADAQHDLANIYLSGERVPRDFKKAMYWLERASSLGHAYAKTRLGCAYFEGMGVSIDKEKGIALLNEAASLGDEKAKELLNSKEVISYANRKDSKGCYIASCVYGSYDCPEVWTLRRFRDNTLKNMWLGRRFIRIYYAISPKIVRVLGNQKWFNKLGVLVLNKLVCTLQNKGVESCQYYDDNC